MSMNLHTKRFHGMTSSVVEREGDVVGGRRYCVKILIPVNLKSDDGGTDTWERSQKGNGPCAKEDRDPHL